MAFTGWLTYTDSSKMTNPQNIIINADDFGISVPCSEKILEVWNAGSLTSISVIVCSPHFEKSMELLHCQKGKLPGVGLHFTLTELFPVALGKGSALVNNKRFKERKQVLYTLMRGLVSRGELMEELEAQWEKLIATGIEPDHIDSHQHIHMYPEVFSVVVEFAARKKVAVRIVRPRLLLPLKPGITSIAYPVFKNVILRITAFYCIRRYGSNYTLMNSSFASIFDFPEGVPVTPDLYLSIVKGKRSTLLELMIHPYSSDEQLQNLYDYKWEEKKRFLKKAETEYRCLKCFSLCELLKKDGFNPMNYGEWKSLHHINVH